MIKPWPVFQLFKTLCSGEIGKQIHLHQFVTRNPRRVASMSTEIEMRLEKEYILVLMN